MNYQTVRPGHVVHVLGVKKGFKGTLPDTPPKPNRDYDREKKEKQRQELILYNEAMSREFDINEAVKGSSKYKKLSRDFDLEKAQPRDKRSTTIIPAYMQ